jgi:hypothetical protein
MSTIIEHLIDQGLAVASSKAAPNDLVCGVLGALRRVRSLVEEIGGANTVPMLDSCLRNRVILRSMRLGGGWSAPAVPLPLPQPGPAAHSAEIIIASAAEACLMSPSEGTDDTEIFMLIFVMVDRLFELLGGVPSIEELFARIRGADEAFFDAEPVVQNSVAAVVH